MNTVSFSFSGVSLQALGTGALFWPDRSLLVVSDLHLGKSTRIARRAGQMLPPYETQDTLQRLSQDLAATGAKTVVSLGDSFDDPHGERDLSEDNRQTISALQVDRLWIWIAGNHDPHPTGLDGTVLPEYKLDGLLFRHIASVDERLPEISGHFHPKLRVNLGGRILSRPCFLLDEKRLVLPSYGTYTGGLWCDNPVYTPYFKGQRRAILTGETPVMLPADLADKRAPKRKSRTLAYRR